MPSMKEGSFFLTILGVTEILCSFRLVLEGKPGKEIPESSRLEFLEKFIANDFALSDAEGNTSGPLNWRGIADILLLRTLLAIHQKSRQPSVWEYSCFISICKFSSFQNPFAMITSLSELYFVFRRFIMSVQTKIMISKNYGSSTSSWKLEMSQAWPDTYSEGYIHQFQPEPTHRIH